MAQHEVISAFLDNEPFDAEALAQALAQPGGRDELLDLVALRAVVQEDAAMTAVTTDPRAWSRQRRTWIAAGFLAATVVFGVGAGILAPTLIDRGRQAGNPSTSEADAPPTPNQVVTFEPGLDWHENNR